ncbi:MAG TPA: hypothetical protein VJS12_23240, partial [Steroidobacteraceae bacterium]|nr:hypothetical protein [Steroidobacteraceae bacterium]
TGKVTMRTVMNGIAVDKFPAIDEHIPRTTWFDVEVHRKNGKTSVTVNGLGIWKDIPQQEFTNGQVGLVAHGAIGRFDKVFLGTPFGDQDFFETFEEAPFVTFTPQSGQWSVVNGTYVNSAVQQTNVTLAPIRTGFFPQDGDTFDFTFRARMLNPYGNTGNQIGIVFNYHTTEYTEVVFSSKGIVELNLIRNRVKQTIATDTFSTAPNRAFNVTVEDAFDHFAVVVDGKQLFQNVDTTGVNPGQVPDGGVGLITHWSPGRFDNIQFHQGIFAPCSLTFSEQPPAPLTVVNGEWNTTGGTLNNSSLDSTDIVNFAACSGPNIYSARLRNDYGASGNRVGLIYDYQSFGLRQGDYYEVTFSPTGVVQMNKFVQGVLYPVRTASYPPPGKAFFDVQLIRQGVGTTIKVNGATVVELEPQGRMGGGVGVVSHWTKGHFDDVKITELVQSAPSEL